MQLTRKYGATLCYTPMYNSKLWAAAGEGSGTKGEFYTVPEDRPLLVQVPHRRRRLEFHPN